MSHLIQSRFADIDRNGASIRSVEIKRGVVAANFALFMGLILAVWASPSEGYVLVLSNPQGGAETNISVIGDAGGSFVESGRYPWISVAYSDGEDFAGRLMRSGALLVLNHSLAVGCLRGN